MPELLGILSIRFPSCVQPAAQRTLTAVSSLDLETIFPRGKISRMSYHSLLFYVTEASALCRAIRERIVMITLTKHRGPKAILSERTDFDRRR